MGSRDPDPDVYERCGGSARPGSSEQCPNRNRTPTNREHFPTPHARATRAQSGVGAPEAAIAIGRARIGRQRPEVEGDAGRQTATVPCGRDGRRKLATRPTRGLRILYPSSFGRGIEGPGRGGLSVGGREPPAMARDFSPHCSRTPPARGWNDDSRP
jgi:hypothetical protein